MKYYEVTSEYYNNGKVSAQISQTIEAETTPESKVITTKKCDVYIDYFSSKKAAEEFIKEAYNA